MICGVAVQDVKKDVKRRWNHEEISANHRCDSGCFTRSSERNSGTGYHFDGSGAGEGLLVYDAAKKWQDGESMENLAEWVLKRRLSVCHWFTVDTMEYLKKGGRVSAAAVGSIFQIKPLLHVDKEGRLVLAGKPRGRRQAREEKLRCLKEGWDPSMGRRIMLAHGDCYEEAVKLKEEIEAQLIEAECLIAPVGPIIGIHTGPGMIACCFWGTKR